MSSPPQSSPDNPLYQSFLKGAKGRPPIDKWHHYFDIYHRHFAEFRDRRPTLLEIGVQNGGSLHMWKDYFGPGARLFGIDIDPACAERAPEGAKVFIGDQADPAFLKSVVAETGLLDIIIDDGGHMANQMIVSFQNLYLAMRTPGVYVVEDTFTQFWPDWVDDPKNRSFIQYATTFIGDLHEWTRKSELRQVLRTPPEQRPEPLPAGKVARTTSGISFYDSMVVFTRQARPEPWAEFRTQDPDLPAILPTG